VHQFVIGCRGSVSVSMIAIQVKGTIKGVRALLGIVATGLCLALTGCGGGGGGGNAVQDPNVSAVFSTSEVNVKAIEGDTAQAFATATATLNYKGARDIFIGVIEEQGLLETYAVDITSAPYRLDMRFKAGRLAGTYTSQLKLLACYDRACVEQAPGSPMLLPLRFQVTPNLQVQPRLALSRTGLEAAPGAKVAVTVPASAGALSIVSGGGDDGIFSIALVGNELSVTTQQLRAGRYTKRVDFAASASTVYRAGIDIEYVVNPPPGGELQLALRRLNPGDQVVQQGDTYRERFRVQRPTWVVDNAQPQLEENVTGRASLRAVGGDEFEVAVDSTGLAAGSSVRFSVTLGSRLSGTSDSLLYLVDVAGVFAVGSGLGVRLDGTSTVASLRLAAPVISFAGPGLRWTARSLTPWMSLVRSTGIAGVDNLEVQLDPATATTVAANQGGEIEVKVDRPGTLAQVVSVGVSNFIPTLGPALRGPLLAGASTLYLDGNLFDTSGLDRCLSVTGASLRQATALQDTRFIGSQKVLQVTLGGAIAGQDTVLRCVTPLLTSEVRVPVRTAPRVPAGYAVLPFNSWRSAQFSQRQDALLVAGEGAIARWALVANSWTLSSKPVPGLIDAALYGDHSFLVGVGQRQAWRIDAATLGLTANASFVQSAPIEFTIDPTPLAGMAGLVLTADGASHAAGRESQFAGALISSGMKGLGGLLSPLTGSFANGGDPGNNLEQVVAAGPQSSGVVRSPNGAWVVGQAPSGRLRVYEAANRQPVAAEQLAAGTTLRAVSDDGQRRLRSDGVLHVGGVPVAGSLAGRLPAGFVVGGYGLTGKGNHALVYGYRIASETAGPRAREAAVWVFDISNAATQGIISATLLDRLVLTDAVGCTATLQAGESCEHVATVVVAEGDQSAFVLGPRGVAALPLPLALVVGAGATATSPAAAVTRQQFKTVGVVKGQGPR
jgi:hypothetical protein